MEKKEEIDLKSEEMDTDSPKESEPVFSKKKKASDMSEKGKKSDKSDKQDKNARKKLSKTAVWTIKITIITLCLAIVVSFITEMTTSVSNVVVSILILCLLIVIAIIFDAIGVAATSCDIAPLLSMAARKVKGANVAVKLVKNASKVANICNDVIGDIAGIISGTCAAAIILKFAIDNPNQYLYSIILSSAVSAITVGGKAFFKNIAIKNSKEMILFAARVIGVFYHPKAKK